LQPAKAIKIKEKMAGRLITENIESRDMDGMRESAYSIVAVNSI
jgi:hypothetical protein